MGVEQRVVVKRVPNAVLFSDGTIRIDNVRLSFPHIFTPRENKGEDGKVKLNYQATGLLPKASHKEAMSLINDVIKKILADNKATIAADKKFLKDGDLAGREEYVGHYSVSASETNKPQVRGADKSKLGPDDAHLVYAGCYVNLLIRPWFQNNKFGKRVNANLLAVQFARDGEPFGTGRIRDEEIDDTFDDLDGGGQSFGDDEL